MLFDFAKLDKAKRYKLMSSSIIPRPIAWIVTKQNDIINIAPFSYFTALSSNPPTLLVSIGHKRTDNTPKDTLRNIRETKKCTICIANPKDLQKLELSAQILDKDISEAKEFNITTKEIIKDFPPIAGDSQVAFFCEFYQEIKLGESKTIPIILEIKHQFLDDKIYQDEEIIHTTLSRIGKYFALASKEFAISE
jgi:flavin reductase (DIM6/NTAB) family NADH-FMN oxidoreductase RutF